MKSHGLVTTVLVGGLLPAVLGAPSAAQVNVLVDASRDGGVWWFPQAHHFDPELPHQGKALADYLRGLGMNVTELPRPSTITCELLSGHNLVLAIDLCGSYEASEINAYRTYVSNGGRLILLNDHKGNPSCDIDALSQSFGLDLSGTISGTITSFVAHPITAGVVQIPYQAGSLVTTVPAEATILGYLSGSSVMGVLPWNSGLIFFIGDTNGIEGIPQPFVDNLLDFMLARATRVNACLGTPVVQSTWGSVKASYR